MLPISLRNKIEILGSESQRQAGNIVLEIWKTMRKNVFLYSFQGVKMYNSLAFGIKQRDRLKIFKSELKEYILNTIQYF